MFILRQGWFRFTLIALLLFSASLPVYKKESSDFALFEKGIEGITSQLTEGAWSFVQDAAESLKNRLFEEDKPIPLTPQERLWDSLRTGWQYGLSTIGATEKALHDRRFNLFHLPSVLITSLLGILVLEIFFIMLHQYLGKYLGVLGMIGMLMCLTIFGELNKDEEYNVVLGGIVIFSSLQLSVLLYSIILGRHSNDQ
jgi:hypothetical protein